MFTIDHSEYFWLIILTPATGMIYLFYFLWQRSARKKFGNKMLFTKMTISSNELADFLKNKYFGCNFSLVLCFNIFFLRFLSENCNPFNNCAYSFKTLTDVLQNSSNSIFLSCLSWSTSIWSIIFFFSF